jgi:hypothetical protein
MHFYDSMFLISINSYMMNFLLTLSFLSTKTNISVKLFLPLEVDSVEFCELQNYGIQENGF